MLLSSVSEIPEAIVDAGFQPQFRVAGFGLFHKVEKEQTVSGSRRRGKMGKAGEVLGGRSRENKAAQMVDSSGPPNLGALLQSPKSRCLQG